MTEKPRLGQGGGRQDPFREATKVAAECREAIREALKPIAARGAHMKAIVTFNGTGGLDISIELRS